MRYLLLCLLLFAFIASSLSQNQLVADQNDKAVLAKLGDFSLHAEGENIIISAVDASGLVTFKLNDKPDSLNFQDGRSILPVETSAKGELYLFETKEKTHSLYHIAQKGDEQLRIRHIPLYLSLLPPLIAIIFALVFQEVILSLFAGIWAGAFIAGGMRIESIYYFLLSFLEVVQIYILKALSDEGHLSIFVFSLLIGGMVALISRNGGMAGVVKSLSRFAKSSRSAQFITWLLGIAIFFDDYANTLIVGNTMRSVTDKFKVSREKLAYLVDSTAAPVVSVAFITTWIGAELGYIDDGISQLVGFDSTLTPYVIFLSSLKYSFYPILTLFFVLILIYTQRDFGPMLQAERRSQAKVSLRSAEIEEGASTMEDLSPVSGAPLKWQNAVIPVGVVILMTIFGLLDTGITNSYQALAEAGYRPSAQSWGIVWATLDGITPSEDTGFFVKLGTVIGNADSYIALLWASLSGLAVAIFLTLLGKIMKLGIAIDTLTTGFKAMLPALIILTLAWSLAATTERLHTAAYLTSSLQDSLNPFLIPTIIFILAALISFSTGSSWSTMAILYPIAIPITWAICVAQGVDPETSVELLLNVISVVLAASVLGDHCSPISDTTILSSLASDCNHIDHVRTQLPYALTVGAVSLVANTLATVFGGGWWICLLLLLVSMAILYLVVLRVGRLK